MTQMLLDSKVVAPKTKDERLFSGIWLRWAALTPAERLICANIVLFPIWWLVGIPSYMLLIFLLSALFYEWQHYGKIRFKKPSFLVLALFAYYLYACVDAWLIFFNLYPSINLPSGSIVSLNETIRANLQLSLPCLVWYIQSRQIKVRLETVAWACSIGVLQMLLLWLVVQFILPGAFNPPPRTLYAVLTGKSAVYEFGRAVGDGARNYLLIKEEGGRFRFFFDHYQTCAVFLGFVGLLALDLKNRLWSLLLFVTCCFLLGTSGARAVWLAFAPAVLLHFFATYMKTKGMWLVLALLATLSFLTLSLPPVTDSVFHTLTDTQQSIADARPGSSEVRSKVYQQTLEKIPDKIIFGHKVEGESAIQGPSIYTDEGAPIGSHSFILGTLLYQKGIFGTVLFATFWGALLYWMYETRYGRPLSCFLVLLMLMLTSSVSIIHLTMIMTTLLCIVIRQPTMNILGRRRKLYA